LPAWKEYVAGEKEECIEEFSEDVRLHMLPLQSRESNKHLRKAIQSIKVKVDPLVS